MISKEMTKSLNEQIMKELYSGYLYQSMAIYSADSSLKGFASWFQIQALEEFYHAEKIYNYIMGQSEKVELLAINKPPADFKSPLDLFEKTLAHERTVTASINSLVQQAKKENDEATLIFLQWFVSEQVEEESIPAEIIGRIKVAGNQGGGLFMLDNELGQRVYNPPVQRGAFKFLLP